MKSFTQIVLMFTALSGFSQEKEKGNLCLDDMVNLFIVEADLVKSNEATSLLQNVLKKLEQKQRKCSSQMEYARWIYRKIHNELLETYVRYDRFSSIFESGSYNCLTGTALYAIVYENLGYDIQIFETRYHSFLLITTSDGEMGLIETTDPFNGFVTGTDMQKRIDDYLQKEVGLSADSLAIPVHRYPQIQEIDLTQLAGLHCFNLAVVEVNNADYESALSNLSSAASLYPTSLRVKDLSALASDLVKFGFTTGGISQNQFPPNHPKNENRPVQ